MAAVEAETPPKTLDRSSFFQLRLLSSSQSLKKWSPETLTSNYRKPMRSESVNIKSRKRFFLCFRPVAMDEPLTSDRQPSPGDKVFAFIPVTDKGDSIVPTISSPLSEKKEKKKEEDESSKIYARRKRRSARRIFSAIVNAVSFDTKLKRKLRNLRNRKVRQDPYRADVSQEAKTSCVSPCQKISDDDDRNAISSVSSSASSSCVSFSSGSRSSTSSTSSSAGKTNHSRSNSLEVKQNDRSVGSIRSNLQQSKQKSKKKKVGSGFYRSCYGLLLILISFSFLIFWGRLYAILCTSAWLYLAPRPNPESHLREDIDSPEYKKKVIMEGLLERSRSHRANC